MSTKTKSTANAVEEFNQYPVFKNEEEHLAYLLKYRGQEVILNSEIESLEYLLKYGSCLESVPTENGTRYFKMDPSTVIRFK
jgi:hypothetical protein